MSVEGESRRAENFIGDTTFGITKEYIQAHFIEMQKELAEINTELAQEDIPEQMRKFAEGRKLTIKIVLGVSPDEIFRSLQEVYNLVHALEESGLAKTDILKKIEKEKPNLFQDIVKFYGILRSQPWGYRLGQELLAFRVRR